MDAEGGRVGSAAAHHPPSGDDDAHTINELQLIAPPVALTRAILPEGEQGEFFAAIANQVGSYSTQRRVKSVQLRRSIRTLTVAAMANAQSTAFDHVPIVPSISIA